MANKLSVNKIGLTLGIFAALLHLVWSLLVLIGVAQGYLDWIFPMHFLNNIYQVTQFSIGYAITLIVLAFVGGYIMGTVFAYVWNYIDKKIK